MNSFQPIIVRILRRQLEKEIRCGTRDLGYARYKCLGCPGNSGPVFVCFTYKSCFCYRCGKKYTDDWSEKQQEMIFDVPHRHIVVTIPKELRTIFFKDRKKLNELAKQEEEVFQYHYEKRSKRRQLKVGVIIVNAIADHPPLMGLTVNEIKYRIDKLIIDTDKKPDRQTIRESLNKLQTILNEKENIYI